MNARAKILTALLAATAPLTFAHAVSISFETLPNGQAPTLYSPVNNAYQALGVRFSSLSPSDPGRPQWGTFSGHASSIVIQDFQRDNAAPFHVLAEFTSPVTRVSADLFGPIGYGVYMIARNASGAEIGRTSVFATDFAKGRATLQNIGLISSVVWMTTSQPEIASVGIDNLEFDVAAAPMDAYVSGFESGQSGAFPSDWEYRFEGGGAAISSTRAFTGRQALRMVGEPFSAGEVHTLRRFPAARGRAVLNFALLWSSESTNPGLDCNDIIVNYQNPFGQLFAGFWRTNSHPEGLYLMGTDRPVEKDRWYQFVAMADYANKTVDWYIDGELVVARQAMTPGTTDPSRVNRLEFHAGCIDEGLTVAYLDGLSFAPPPTCPADITGDGGLSVQDLFDFLGLYFSGCP